MCIAMLRQQIIEVIATIDAVNISNMSIMRENVITILDTIKTTSPIGHHLLVATIDERVCQRSEAMRVAWAAMPLYTQRVSHLHAGVDFYTQLDDLLKSTSPMLADKYMAYICLRLGFGGMHASYDVKRQHYVRLLHTQLQTAWSQKQNTITPHQQKIGITKKILASALPGLFAVLVYGYCVKAFKLDWLQALATLTS